MAPSPIALYCGFVLLFALYGILLPGGVLWDGIGFLERSRDLTQIDLPHLFYPLLVRLTSALQGILDAPVEKLAKLWSVLGAALAFILLWRRGSSLGASTPLALCAALLVATSPRIWWESVLVEPSTLTLAALLVAAEIGRALGPRTLFGRALATSLVCVLPMGFHVLSVLAWPWLFLQTKAPENAGATPSSRLRPLMLILLVVASAGALFGYSHAFGHGPPLGDRVNQFVETCKGFLPGASSAKDLMDGVAAHAITAWRILGEGEPGLLTAAGTALIVVGIATPAALAHAVLLAGPYLLMFLICGKPVVGLLLPVYIALHDSVASGTAFAERSRWTRRIAAAVLPVLVLAQSSVSLGQAVMHCMSPDLRKQQALAIANAAPEGSVLAAGELALHLRFYTDAEVIVLPEVMLYERGRSGPDFNVRAALDAAVQGHLRKGMRVFATPDGVQHLAKEWNLPPGEWLIGKEPEIVISESPPLKLVELTLPQASQTSR